MNNLLLITKLKTTNIGNQALSDEVIKLYERNPQNLSVSGRPEGLFGYSIEKLKKAKDPIAKFESWSDNLIKYLQSTEQTFNPKSARVELLSFDDFKVKNDNLFQAIKNIFRKHIHMEWLFARSYKNRFAKICSVDAVVYSGAGEVGDNNIFLRQLLELRLAQKLGKKTYAINQSVEVNESPIKEIYGVVYSKMDKIVVRGNLSRDNMISAGISAEKIECYPDSAFLNPEPSTELVDHVKKQYRIVQPSVGINATKVARDMKAWKEITDLLRSLGYHLYFISNDPYGDKEIGEELARNFGLVPIIEFMDYAKYSALLASFEFVISCRLHTNELSLTAGTPVIPIEGSRFKTREVFNLIGYPLSVANASSGNWVAEVKQNISILHGKDAKIQGFVLNLGVVQELSCRNYLMT